MSAGFTVEMKILCWQESIGEKKTQKNKKQKQEQKNPKQYDQIQLLLCKLDYFDNSILRNETESLLLFAAAFNILAHEQADWLWE